MLQTETADKDTVTAVKFSGFLRKKPCSLSGMFRLFDMID